MTVYVLVPGAWLGSWVWKRVVHHLEVEGGDVYPVTLTGMGERVHLLSPDTGIETAISDVMNVLRFNELDDVVLVGHSFAAKVVSSVGDRMPERVRTIIFLDTFWPQKVRTPQLSFTPDDFGPIAKDQITLPFTTKVLEAIGKDVKGDDRKWMMTLATPWPLRYATDPITLTEKYDGLKTSHIFCTNSGYDVNEPISGKWGKLEGEYRTIEASHFPMVTKPAETARAIIELSST